MPRLFGPNVQLRDPDRNHLWKWIRINESRLGECAFSVDALKPDSIRFNAHWVSSVNRPLVDASVICCGSAQATCVCSLSLFLGERCDFLRSCCLKAVLPAKEGKHVPERIVWFQE